MKRLMSLALALAALLLAACGGGAPVDEYGTPVESGAMPEDSAAPFAISSAGVRDGMLDPTYGVGYNVDTSNEASVSLPVTFKNPPPGTAGFALVFQDPDSLMEAGYVQVLWLAANIAADTGELPANASAQGAGAMVQGNNTGGGVGYTGPAAEEGIHTCVLTAYALDTALPLEEGFSLAALEEAMEGHILDRAELEAKVDFGRLGLGG